VSGPAPGPVHRLSLRVYYEDTDAAGIVYYANYLKFAERGRTEMLRTLGFSHTGARAETGLVSAVRRCAVEYHTPARLDDLLTVETRLVRIAGATLALRQCVCRGDELLAALDVLVACVSPEGRPRRVPASLRDALINPSGSGSIKPAPAPLPPEYPPSGHSIVQKTP
jgi:acyl-CoA thioester hydrolase